MSTRLSIRTLLRHYLPRYGEPPREHVTDAVERVWQTMEPRAAYPKAWNGSQPEAPVRWSHGRSLNVRFAAAAVLAVATAVGTAIVWGPADDALHAVAEGEVHDDGGSIRSNGGGAGAVLVLKDGSRVEMRSQSELSLDRANDGVRIRLKAGGIIVNAAEQRTGHLYVETRDVTVSVVGTVFLVNAEEQGSRVAVIEGEVRVQRGVTDQKLRPGEQVATTESLHAPSLKEAVAWSRNATVLGALLQQAEVVLPVQPVERAAAPTEFEVVSIRRTVADGGGGRGGAPRRNPRPAGEPCGSPEEPMIDSRRFDAANTTVHALMTWAYGLGCSLFRGSDFLAGEPGWVKEDGYEVQAVVPGGVATYTRDQLHANRAPQLQRLLQSLLADRFKLVLRREPRDTPVYLLTVVKGGPKLIAPGDTRKTPAEAQPPSAPGVRFPPGFAAPVPVGLSVFADGDSECCEIINPEVLTGRKKSMGYLAGTLTFLLGRPVLDRTSLTGEFNYNFTFERQQMAGLPVGAVRTGPRPPGLPPPDPRSIFAAIEEDLGLRLEPAVEKIEMLVIERVERPTEN